MRTLSPAEARGYYDRFGRKQDLQSFYEDAALGLLKDSGQFSTARRVFEYGCGTGRLAAELLEHELPASASYCGADISPTMIGIALSRLRAFEPRAALMLSSGPEIPLADSSVDRVISTYVLDLLAPDAARKVVEEAHRVLAPGGLLCLVGITFGTTRLSRRVMATWEWLFRRNPSWVGGCRPQSSRGLVGEPEWDVRLREVVVSWGIASEVTVAAST